MKLIAFIGTDGTGKTSILNSVYDDLVSLGKNVVRIKPESKDTEAAYTLRLIREAYRKQGKSKQQELNQKIAEALAVDILKTSEKIKREYNEYDYVLVDRWTMCQEIYDKVWFVWNDFIKECLSLCHKPDIVFLITAEMKIIEKRIASRSTVKETETPFALRRVDRMYRKYAAENEWVLIDNNGPLGDSVLEVLSQISWEEAKI